MTKLSEQYPPPHARYLVHRDGKLFTATPCYGMHSPWWVVATMEGEADPVGMDVAKDSWLTLDDAAERIAR